jgi:hypothetical protein
MRVEAFVRKPVKPTGVRHVLFTWWEPTSVKTSGDLVWVT